MPEDFYCLSEAELFRDLSRREMAELGARAPLREVAAGQVVFSPHRPVADLFVVKRGRIWLYRISAAGTPVTTGVLGPGSVFGEVRLLGLRMGANWAEALEPSQLCVLSPHHVRRLLLADPRIAARVAEHLGARIVELEHQLTDLASQSLLERLATALWTLSGGASAGSPPQAVRLTHQQLAGLVHASRERTTAALGELADRGLVRLHRAKITVPSRERLLGYLDTTEPGAGELPRQE
ncbi:Crp/Fnr family transcriptional regulator [Saccharopolyspora indica]|uniref:Crp/Fnr family transcriptional regulator n=1 Tax=Saccharopolyspora indica TaxID=1229659 RepID=UPI0022EA2966|nr:Crp/Fnr family transcriptional regulator [Saccharopolyspora indica]MDA3645254.1 Crp/Fnr family transcriptional regulator [Saccharopolyspora indica]